jgi:hypothetical protein
VLLEKVDLIAAGRIRSATELSRVPPTGFRIAISKGRPEREYDDAIRFYASA